MVLEPGTRLFLAKF